ncbi:MAG: hypothetical protein WKF63_00790 [Thermomicrobiales bacterium]
MTAFRDLVSSVREQWDTAVAQAQAQSQGERQAPVRPTSIHAAGSTGASDVERARMRQDRARGQDSQGARDNTHPEGAVPNDQELRPRRRSPVQASAPVPRSDSRTALLTALRSPASLRTAILLREVLDPPVALRGDDPPFGERGGR